MLEKMARAIGILQMAEAHLINARSAYHKKDWVKFGGHVGATIDLGYSLVSLFKGEEEDESTEE